MRTDLEQAMAAVITSRSASERFVHDPELFGREFLLDQDELDKLLEMGRDLTSLTGSFVTKRAGTLRWNARRTLELLGEEGDDLLDEFVDTHPMTDQFRVEAALFGDFVVERTSVLVGGPAEDEIVAEMARFERCRSDSFWDATYPSESPLGGVDTKTAVPPGTVLLRPGANVGRFSWDLRLAYRRDVEPWDLLLREPTDLLFFHNHRQDGLRILRLRPLDAAVVGALRPGDLVGRETLDALPLDTLDIDRILEDLAFREVVEWATPS